MWWIEKGYDLAVRSLQMSLLNVRLKHYKWVSWTWGWSTTNESLVREVEALQMSLLNVRLHMDFRLLLNNSFLKNLPYDNFK